MNFDKKTILAFLLIGLVFIFVQTPIYKKTFFPNAYKMEQLKKQQILTQPVEEKQKDFAMERTEERTLTPTEKSVEVRTQSKPLEAETLITVENDLYVAVFSSRGASLKSWTLKKYKDGHRNAVSMIPANAEIGNLGIAFVDKQGDSLDTALWSFQSNQSLENIFVRDRSFLMSYSYDFGEGRKIVKEFEFLPNSYSFFLKIKLQNLNEIIADKAYTLNAPTGLRSTEKRLNEDMSFAKAIIAAGGEVDTGYKPNGKINKETGTIDWVSVRTKYFAMAIIPLQQNGNTAQVQGFELPVSGEDAKWKHFTISLGMAYTKQNEEDLFTVFLGPMDDGILKSYDVGLERIMDRGAKIIQPFSIATLWLFKKIHLFVPNYGLVLIIFSILIKVLVSPLTHKSYQSMQKMQALQPKLVELKEKYSTDPNKLNKETMKLYKEQGVNPMGGCLPILLQMPLLWALFIVFRSTIELRQEGFFWWITDLSGPDTIALLPFTIPLYGNTVNVLPVLMGLTMILQQKMSVTDPKQKAMIYIMPVFMTVLFNSFPSGLNLYYTLFNILSIVQQKYVTKRG